MNPFGEKYIVVNLPGIPVKDLALCGAETAGKIRHTHHGNGTSGCPRCEAKICIRGTWVDGGAAVWRSRINAVVAQPERIEELGSNPMVLLQRCQLASGPGQNQLVVKLVVLRGW